MIDCRSHGVLAANELLAPELGPGLGGGVAGTYLGSGFRQGGGLSPPVNRVIIEGPNTNAPAPRVRRDFRRDFSTPRLLADRRHPHPLARQLGGLS